MPTKRVFIAIKIELNKELQLRWQELKEQLCDERIRWVSPANLHLTLRFLGDLLPMQIDAVKGAMRKACNACAPFALQLNELSFFTHRGHPSVIFLGIQENEMLVGFAHLLQQCLRDIEIPSNKKFHPHLTLGRIKRLVDEQQFYDTLSKLNPTPDQEVGVARIILYESVLKPSGPQYHVLEEYAL